MATEARAGDGAIETTAEAYVDELGRNARRAARRVAVTGTEEKNAAIMRMAAELVRRADRILAANEEDVRRAHDTGMSGALIDRLTLTKERITGIADGLRAVAALPDPVGETVSQRRLPNGLEVGQVRVPLGVIGIIYESRPNVTADAAALCLKAGNAVVLRGGSDALASNRAIAACLAGAAVASGLPGEVIQLVDRPEREAAVALMRARGVIDVLIPRGGPGLIAGVVESARVPVIETGMGVCHTFVDASANLEQALAIALNAKLQRPSVCNALETLLIHEHVATRFLPQVVDALLAEGVTIKGCAKTRAVLGSGPEDRGRVAVATEDDWAAEYLDLVLAVRVVGDMDEALDHIATYGSGHSDAIVTQDYTRARRFVQEVDSAAVYVNASTRFTDGYEFGLGAEIGISTQKLHARGPMGLTALTSIKSVVFGDGHVRT